MWLCLMLWQEKLGEMHSEGHPKKDFYQNFYHFICLGYAYKGSRERGFQIYH